MDTAFRNKIHIIIKIKKKINKKSTNLRPNTSIIFIYLYFYNHPTNSAYYIQYT